MEWISYLIIIIFIVPVSGMIFFSVLYAWGSWFTNGEFKEDESYKTWLTVIALGLLFVWFIFSSAN